LLWGGKLALLLWKGNVALGRKMFLGELLWGVAWGVECCSGERKLLESGKCCSGEGKLNALNV